jgi:hypothetical protein
MSSEVLLITGYIVKMNAIINEGFYIFAQIFSYGSPLQWSLDLFSFNHSRPLDLHLISFSHSSTHLKSTKIFISLILWNYLVAIFIGLKIY